MAGFVPGVVVAKRSGVRPPGVTFESSLFSAREDGGHVSNLGLFEAGCRRCTSVWAGANRYYWRLSL